MGFGVGLGAELKNLQLTLSYDFGGTEIGKKVTNSHVTTNLNPFFDMKEKKSERVTGVFFLKNMLKLNVREPNASGFFMPATPSIPRACR